MTERGLILTNFTNYSLETTRSSNNDGDKAALPVQTLLDFSWRNPNSVVGQHNTKTHIPGKKFDIKRWVKIISSYVWTFVFIAHQCWKCLLFILQVPTKKWIQYQTVHYYASTQLSPVSSHLLR